MNRVINIENELTRNGYEVLKGQYLMTFKLASSVVNVQEMKISSSLLEKCRR